MNAVRLDENALKEAVFKGLLEGVVNIPHMLLRHYRQFKLSDEATMLLIHLICFTEKEHKQFPTIEEIQARMSADPAKVLSLLQQLLQEQWIQIEDHVDSATGIHYERYNLTSIYSKLADLAAKEMMEQLKKEQLEQADREKRQMKSNDIYTDFEQEFGRPLTPMELESITLWLDNDRYSEELIRAALKEAVFSGKVNFRYIDRILLEWSRNRVQTVDQAREYAKQFRSRMENG